MLPWHSICYQSKVPKTHFWIKASKIWTVFSWKWTNSKSWRTTASWMSGNNQDPASSQLGSNWIFKNISLVCLICSSQTLEFLSAKLCRSFVSCKSKHRILSTKLNQDSSTLSFCLENQDLYLKTKKLIYQVTWSFKLVERLMFSIISLMSSEES